MATHAHMQIDALVAVMSVARQVCSSTEAIEKARDGGPRRDLEKMRRKEIAKLGILVEVASETMDPHSEFSPEDLAKTLRGMGFPT